MVCSFASFAARLRPEPFPFPLPTALLPPEEEEEDLEDLEEEGWRSNHSVTKKYVPLWSWSSPWLIALGHNEGTISWIAFRDAYSPANIVFAAGPGEVLTKNFVGCEMEGEVDVRVWVVVKDEVLLWGWIEVWFDEGMEREWRRAGSGVAMRMVDGLGLLGIEDAG